MTKIDSFIDFSKRKKIVSFGIIVLLSWYFAIRPSQIHRQAKFFEDDTVDIWLEHIESYDVRPEDRYPLSEMGFRVKSYSEALEQFQPTDVFRLDRTIWDFIPFLHELRSKVGLDRTVQGKVNSALHKAIKGKQNLGHKRGIITSTDSTNLQSTVEMISLLRMVHNCSLPIEIYYGEEEQIPEMWKSLLETLPMVTLFNAQELHYFDQNILGYSDLNYKQKEALQAIAMLATSFSEAIYIDPEAVFFLNPEELFDQEGYKATGTLFFRDTVKPPLADSQRFLYYLRRQLDKRTPSEEIMSSPFYNYGSDTYQDPSVVVLDRQRPSVFSGLLFNLWLHTFEVREKIWHAHFAEKTGESLWLAFEMAELPYHFASGYPGAVGVYDGTFQSIPWNPTVCPAHPLHLITETSNKGIQNTRPAWMTGSLRVWPGHPVYLDVNAWTPVGRWEQTEKGWCVQGGGDPRPSSMFDLDGIIFRSQMVIEAFRDALKPLFLE